MDQSERIMSASANVLNNEFEVKYQNVISDFFSRDPGKWPILNHPQIQAITEFRQTTQADVQQIGRYPKGSELFSRLADDSHIRQNVIRPGEGQDDLLVFASALCKNWENPLAVEKALNLRFI